MSIYYDNNNNNKNIIIIFIIIIVYVNYRDKPECNVTAVNSMVQMYSGVDNKPLSPGGWCDRGVEALAIPAITLNPAAMKIVSSLCSENFESLTSYIHTYISLIGIP